MIVALKIIGVLWGGFAAIGIIFTIAAFFSISNYNSLEVQKYGVYRGNTLIFLQMVGVCLIWPIYFLFKYTKGMIRGE